MTPFAIVLVGALLASPSGSHHPSHAMAVLDTGCWVSGSRASLSSRASPLDSVVARLGGAEVKVCYSRPSARGRAIMGELVPLRCGRTTSDRSRCRASEPTRRSRR